jgi:hypothetical protein
LKKALIYYTDNSLPDEVRDVSIKWLVKKAKDIPIISVSQKPMDLGTNICVGDIGRSWMSLYKQILAGAEATDAEYVGMIEHDCLYRRMHLKWIPPTKDRFYYNHNCWLVRWADGMYSYFPQRYALSQMVCSRDLLIESLKERIFFLENGYTIVKGIPKVGEPGVADKIAMVQRLATCGRPVQIGAHLPKGILTEYKSEIFSTPDPNLDIRYGGNFSGNKRGKHRTQTLPPWGDFKKDVI